MPSDDPLARPDVMALLEAVAAGDDDSEDAAKVLADVLEKLGLWAEATELRGPAPRFGEAEFPNRSSLDEPVWDVWLPRARVRVWLDVYGPITVVGFPAMPGSDDTSHPGEFPAAERLAAALALAADRVAARAAAKGG